MSDIYIALTIIRWAALMCQKIVINRNFERCNSLVVIAEPRIQPQLLGGSKRFVIGGLL